MIQGLINSEKMQVPATDCAGSINCLITAKAHTSKRIKIFSSATKHKIIHLTKSVQCMEKSWSWEALSVEKDCRDMMDTHFNTSFNAILWPIMCLGW